MHTKRAKFKKKAFNLHRKRHVSENLKRWTHPDGRQRKYCNGLRIMFYLTAGFPSYVVLSFALLFGTLQLHNSSHNLSCDCALVRGVPPRPPNFNVENDLKTQPRLRKNSTGTPNIETWGEGGEGRGDAAKTAPGHHNLSIGHRGSIF